MAAEQKVPRLSELEDEKSGKKAKAPKLEKNKKPGKDASAPSLVAGKDGVKEKKPPGALFISLIVSLFWVFLMSACVLLVLFDPTEGGAIRGPVLLFLNPDELPREEYYAAEFLEIAELQNSLDSEFEEIERLNGELDLREEGLDEREGLLEEREFIAEDLIEQYTEFFAAAGASGGGDIPMAAKVFETMTPTAAAKTFENMDFDTAIGIMRQIKTKSLGPIFDAMAPEMASEFMDTLGTPPDTIDD